MPDVPVDPIGAARRLDSILGRAALPYTYTDDAGDTLTITAGPGARIVVKMSIPDDEQGVTEHVASVVAPKGADAAHLTHVLLTAGEMGDHMVIARAQVDRLVRAEAATSARSMRERAAQEVVFEPHRVPMAISDAILALPLLPDTDDTLPEADMVEPGDEVPALAELHALMERLAIDLSETTKAVTKRLATVEDRLGITDDTTEGPARYRDADGDLWEQTGPGHLRLARPQLLSVGMARPYDVVNGEFGPLTPLPGGGFAEEDDH